MVHRSPFNVLHLVMQPAYRGSVRKATNGQLLENFDKKRKENKEKNHGLKRLLGCHGHGLRSIIYDIVFIRAILYPRSSVSVTARKPERYFEKGNSGVSVQESKRVFSAYSIHERKRTAARGISFNAYGVPGSRLKYDLKQFHAILSQFLKRHRNKVSLKQILIEILQEMKMVNSFATT